jgi:hypothetical protein
MEELLCNIEFEKDETGYSARLRTDMGGLREYNGLTLEEVINEVILELQEEFSP